MSFEIDGLAYTVENRKAEKVVVVKDTRNGHSAELAINATGVFYVISSTFPRGGKRYFEMLYAAEVNKRRLV